MGLFAIVFFFFVPLLYVPLGPRLSHVPSQPSDYRPWLGTAASFNFIGLLCFFAVRTWADGVVACPRRIWVFSPRRFYSVAAIALAVSFLAQVYFVVRIGGVSNLMSRETDLSGMGIFFLFSESFPALLFCIVLIHLRINKQLHRSTALMLFLVCVSLAFVFAGLRGSRSNFLNSVMIMAVVLNYQGFWISKRSLIIALIPLSMFLVVYALFKQLRNDFGKINSVESYVALSEKTGRDWKGVLLGDIGRANIEALTCYRLENKYGYKFAYGSTYLGAACVLLPRVIRPEIRTTKVASSDLLYGMGAYSAAGDSRRESTRIFGLAGEAMLNFGYWGIPVVFSIAGYAVSKTRSFFMNLPVSDMRVFLYPMFLRVIITIWHLDVVNMVFAIVKNSGFIFIVIFLISDRVTLRSRK
ncbi:hypothetical protein [Aporhodopirellula aestuarii]|nr:hypothetical protein [Aporhodopirellula aestuarii]